MFYWKMHDATSTRNFESASNSMKLLSFSLPSLSLSLFLYDICSFAKNNTIFSSRINSIFDSFLSDRGENLLNFLRETRKIKETRDRKINAIRILLDSFRCRTDEKKVSSCPSHRKYFFFYKIARVIKLYPPTLSSTNYVLAFRRTPPRGNGNRHSR